MTQAKRLLAVLLVAVFGFALAACGSDSESDGTPNSGTTSESQSTTDGEATPDGVEGVTWALMNIGSKDGWATGVPAGIDLPTLEFSDGKVAVFTGCNSGSGSADVAESLITFGPIGTTMKACEETQAQIEAIVTKLLQDKVKYEINSDGNLVLERKRDILVYTPE